MDEWLRNLIVKKWKIKALEFSFLDALLAVCITGTGVMLRLAVNDYTPMDGQKQAGLLLELFLIIVCAVIVHDYTGSRNKAFLTFAILAIYPTLVANGALWGQNSSQYAFPLFLGLCILERGERLRGAVALVVGAILAAVRLKLSAATLNLGWPNLYEIIGKSMFVELYNQVALLCLLGILFTIAYVFVKKRIALTRDLILRLFLFLALLLPYLAPSMPASAGFTADIAALLYCMRWPRKFYVPMLHLIASYSSYAYVINGETKLPMVLYAVILLALLADTGIEIYKEIIKIQRSD